MKTKFVFALLFISLIALSSAETIYYGNYNDKIISSYNIVYDDYEGFTRTVKITDSYESLNEDYSRYYRYNYDKDYNYKYWKYNDYRRTSDLDENQDYYIYESPYRDATKLIKCYDEAPKGKLFYTKCP